MADNKELLFDTLDSNYIILNRINDVLDDIPEMEQVDYGNGLAKNGSTLKIDDKFLEVKNEIRKVMWLYSNR